MIVPGGWLGWLATVPLPVNCMNRAGVFRSFLLVLLVHLVRATTASFALVLALASAFGLAFALVAIALIVMTPIRVGLRLQLNREALLVIALIFVVLAAPTEGTGNGTPVVFGHFSLAASVRLLFLALHHEALVPILVWPWTRPTFSSQELEVAFGGVTSVECGYYDVSCLPF